MGYTRYWNVNEAKMKEGFDTEFLGRISNIVNAAKEYNIVIKNGLGEDKPIINKELIALNGDASVGLDHESLVFSKENPLGWGGSEFDFCKTACKPYDAVVFAVLIVAEEYGYIREVSNDGPCEMDEIGMELLEKSLKVD